MATTWSDILTSGAMVLIDDVRWQEQLAVSPAMFFRAKSLYVSLALPLLSRPPELLSFLQNGMDAPTYDDYSYTTTPDSVKNGATVETGKIGYQLMSVVQCVTEATGEIRYVPYNEATYDAETGNVTFPPQKATGIVYSIDFYTDGSFSDLTPTMFRLISLAVAVIWDERFSRDYLSLTPKIHDTAFNVVNEANYMDKVRLRLTENRRALSEELRKYEQDVAYHNVVRRGGRSITLI